MTVWPASAAAAIVLGLVLTPIVDAVPATTAAGQSAPVSVTMIARLTAPERKTGFIDPTLLAGYTSEFGILTRQLDQVINRPVVLGIDPSVIASIRILGSDAPPSATAWLARLDSATNETFPLRWADADLTLPLQAGSGAVLAPESFEYAIDPTRFSPAPDPGQITPTPLPTEPVTPDENPLPTSESLVAWDYTVDSIAWPAMNSVTSDDLAALGTDFETTILSSANVGVSNAGTAVTKIGDAQALVSNDALSTLFSATVSTGSSDAWQTAMASLATGVRAVSSTADSPASILLALDRDVATSDTDLGITVDSVATTTGIQVIGIAELLITGAQSANLVDTEHDHALVTATRDLLKDEADDRAFAQIAENPALITGERRLDLLATLSNSWATNSIGWESARITYETTSETLQSSVKIVKSSSITLWADRASLPVTVSNALQQPVTVYVTVRPLTPLVKVENSFVAVTIEPESQSKARVPVQSLSNGIVELEVTLKAESGLEIGDTTYVRTTVQAGWETPFSIGVAILVVLIFVFGIVRTILRRRAARASEQ